MNSIRVFKKTKEDWYPNYKDNLVEVSFLESTYKDGDDFYKGWMVCCWGEDDCGMEKFFFRHQRKEALKTFLEILKLDTVERDKLKILGLHSA